MSKSKIKAALKTAVETRTSKQHGFEVSAKVADKNWWAKISKLPTQQLDHFETKSHIDGGLSYYDDAARGYRLCVSLTGNKKSHRQQVSQGHGTSLTAHPDT